MTLRDLMDNAVDETWFCVVTPDGEEHYFWNADYVGAHPSVMPELEPLLDREFDEFDLTVRQDPEEQDIANAEDKPMVWVGLLKTEEELERDRKAVIASEAVQKEAEGLKDECLYIRSVVPRTFMIVYQTPAGWLILGENALACASFLDCDCQSVGWTEVLSIPDDEIEEAARKILKVGKSVAVGRISTDGLTKGHWEITALITTEKEIGRIKNEGKEEE